MNYNSLNCNNLEHFMVCRLMLRLDKKLEAQDSVSRNDNGSSEEMSEQ